MKMNGVMKNALKSSPVRSRVAPAGVSRCALLAAILLTLSVPACGPADPTEEVVHLKAAGSCIEGTQTFDLGQVGGRLSITGGAALPFPRTGALDGTGHPIRQGGWALWGCLAGNEPCFDAFRFCSAKRQAWQLDVTCLDGQGAVACQAVLTE